MLRTLLDEIVARQEDICRLASRDSGKTLVDAAMGEVFPVCEKFATCSRTARPTCGRSRDPRA